MKCELCNKQAVTTISVKAKHRVKQLHLCKDCFKLYRTDVLQVQMPICRYCGTALDTITCNKSFGCDKCFEEFQKQLKPLLQVLQMKKEKRPTRKRIEELKREMDICVGEENYEMAAMLRDQIFSLENSLGHFL